MELRVQQGYEIEGADTSDIFNWEILTSTYPNPNPNPESRRQNLTETTGQGNEQSPSFGYDAKHVHRFSSSDRLQAQREILVSGEFQHPAGETY